MPLFEGAVGAWQGPALQARARSEWSPGCVSRDDLSVLTDVGSKISSQEVGRSCIYFKKICSSESLRENLCCPNVLKNDIKSKKVVTKGWVGGTGQTSSYKISTGIEHKAWRQ